MDIKTFPITMILIGVFIFSIFMISVNFASDNQIENQLLKDTSISKTMTNISAKLNESAIIASQNRKAVESEINNPILALGYFVLNSILTAVNTFISFTVSIFQTLLVLPSEVLGISPVVIGAFSAIIIISLIIAAWRAWKSGE